VPSRISSAAGVEAVQSSSSVKDGIVGRCHGLVQNVDDFGKTVLDGSPKGLSRGSESYSPFNWGRQVSIRWDFDCRDTTVTVRGGGAQEAKLASHFSFVSCATRMLQMAWAPALSPCCRRRLRRVCCSFSRRLTASFSICLSFLHN
jgi:hypothetical protein